MQMAGRGMRIKSHTDHCLVLDFAGLVETHGPVTDIDPGRTPGLGDAPMKACGECFVHNALNARECKACGHPFPPPKPKPMVLSDYDIMGRERPKKKEPLVKVVKGWRWKVHKSYSSGNLMLMVDYYSSLYDSGVREYITLGYPGSAGQKAAATMATIARKAGVDAAANMSLEDIAKALNAAPPPDLIKYKVDGKFYKIEDRQWLKANTSSSANLSSGLDKHSPQLLESLLSQTAETVH
jgi:DNA repair protein RadD